MIIDNCITECTFRLVSQFSLTLSLGHLFIEVCDATTMWLGEKFKENYETYLKVHCVMQLL